MGKKLLFMFVVLLLSVAGTACGDEEASGQKGDDDLLSVLEQPAELYIYLTSPNTFLEEYREMLVEQFPNYTLHFLNAESDQPIESLVTDQQQIDLIVSSVGLTSRFIFEYEFQTDITDLIEKYDYDLERIEPTSIEIQRKFADGGIYALPMATSTLTIFYNKDIFDKFATGYPADNLTWDELYSLAQSMTRTDEGVNYKGMNMAFTHGMLMNQYGAVFVDPETNTSLFEEQAFRDAFLNMARFFQIPGNEIANNSFSVGVQQNEFYKDQIVAMYLTQVEAANVYKDLLNWDVASVPVHHGVGPQTYPYYFYLTATSKQRDAAFQVMAYMTSDEFQNYVVRTGTLPILKESTEIFENFGKNEAYFEGKNLKAFLPERFADPSVTTRYQDIANVQVNAALNSFVSGTDVNTALREAGEAVNQLIQKRLGGDQ